MTTSNIYGDLFGRRPYLWGRLLSCIMLVSFCVLQAQAQGVAQRSGVGQAAVASLDRRLLLPHGFSGPADSLISIIRQQTGLTVAYSSRVFVGRAVRIAQSRPTVLHCLDAIFARFAPQYLLREGKVVVSARFANPVTISGFVHDALSGEVLVGAHVSDSVMGRVVATNSSGFFSITVPAGNVPLRCSFLGYSNEVHHILASADTVVNVLMTPRITPLGRIDVVQPERIGSDDMRTGMTSLPMDQVGSVPTLMGEADIVQSLQHTPGIYSGAEGFGGMAVRGGSLDQNMVFVDDAPLYNVNHMMGLFSAINSDLINKVVLFKSGFPSRYGGRMSSVLDITTREGSQDKIGGDMNIGLLASSMSMGGCIVPRRLSFVASARRTYFDMGAGLIQRGQDERYSYKFYDLAAKLTWTPSQSDKVNASVLYIYDALSSHYDFQDDTVRYGSGLLRRVSQSDANRSSWGTLLANLRWGHVFSSHLFLQSTAWFSRYAFRGNQHTSRETDIFNYSSGYSNGVRDLGLRCDFSFYPDAGAHVGRAGFCASAKSFSPFISLEQTDGADNESDELSRRNDLHRVELRAYAEDEFRWRSLFATGGVHLALMPRAGNSPFLSMEPRLLMGWQPRRSFRLKLGLSRSAQFVYLLRMLSTATPMDLWLPIPNNMTPQRMSQVSLEMNLRVAHHTWLSVEAYYKRYAHELTYASQSPYEVLSMDAWNQSCASGTGYAKGVEVFLHRRRGRINGWVGYALGHSSNRFPSINGGRSFPSDYDRRHTVQSMASWAFSPRVSISALWNYGSGTPFSLPNQRYKVPGSNQFFVVPAQRNAYRMPASHQLNLSVDIRYGAERHGSKLSFGLYNVYGHRNPMFVYWRQADDGVYRLKQFSLVAFPWPFVKYSVHF